MRRRTLLSLISTGVAARLLPASQAWEPKPKHKVVMVTIAGVRRQETFSTEGAGNIPSLFQTLLPRSLFYPYVANEGVTSHFNSIAGILTGCWQYLDDWGGESPKNPTLMQYIQRQLSLTANDTWVVTSNKQITQNIGAGAHVILSKQLLIEAVERIIQGQSERNRLERESLFAELKSVLENDYERVGWAVPSAKSTLGSELRDTFYAALGNFIHGPESPATADELTYFVACEVLRRASPTFLMVNFSDVEVAHAGLYSLHLAGIRRTDRLCLGLWEYLQTLPAYKDNTTLVILPEFGRDPDGSTTNGFFNHRTNTEACRVTWMMALGRAVREHKVVERQIRQIDVAPTLGSLLGVECKQAEGRRLDDFAI
jgi:hypothetical protein